MGGFPNGPRVGDDLAVFGSGNSTLLAAGFATTPAISGNNGYTIVNPTAGTATAVGFGGTPPSAGDFRLGITFTDSSHVFGSQGGIGFFSRYTSFSGSSGTLLASPVLPDPAGASGDRLFACAVVGGVRLLAVQNTGDARVSIYDLSNPASPTYLATCNNTSGTLTTNGNATGQLAWGEVNGSTAKLYAMSSNQGIQAFNVNTVFLRPSLTATRSNDKIVLSWSTNSSGFGLEFSTNAVPPVSWASASPPAVVSGTNYVVTNSIAGDRQFYRLKK